MSNTPNNIRIAMIGFGNAAQAFCKILLDHESRLYREFNINYQIAWITTGRSGNLVNPLGINLREVLHWRQTVGPFTPNYPDLTEETTEDLLAQGNYDVLIELSPLNIADGQPAITYMETALNQAKHVITANKGPLAFAASRLQQLARAHHVQFLFETTVMDGTPVFNLVKDTLPHCRILGFTGILNTTTNFLLEALAQGRSFEEALEDGKRVGFVEADPAHDIEGYDAAFKTTVLMNTLMDANITPVDVITNGINNLQPADLQAAYKRHHTLKLICQGTLVNGHPEGSVRLQEIPLNHPLATVNGTSAALIIETDLMGSLTIIENDPEIKQTGYGIYSDFYRLLKVLAVRR